MFNIFSKKFNIFRIEVKIYKTYEFNRSKKTSRKGRLSITEKGSDLKCSRCGETKNLDEVGIIYEGEEPQIYCDDCVSLCHSCGECFPIDDIINIGGRDHCKYCVEHWPNN